MEFESLLQLKKKIMLLETVLKNYNYWNGDILMNKIQGFYLSFWKTLQLVGRVYFKVIVLRKDDKCYLS